MPFKKDVIFTGENTFVDLLYTISGLGEWKISENDAIIGNAAVYFSMFLN